MENQILRIALPTPLNRLFDYWAPQGIDPKVLIPGVRIRVPFQSRTLIGILIAVAQESTIPEGKLKSALEVLDSEPIFSADVYQICQWASEYYHHPLGEVLASALPTLLRKGRSLEIKKKSPSISNEQDHSPELNESQQQAVSEIIKAKNSFKVFLLDGVTGSGKTEVYLNTIADCLHDNKQILVLVPEISLTPQTISRFAARFAVPIAVLHSGLSELQRLRVFAQARAGEIKIVIGTRSAIFTSFANLGLIIVDEEHDNSFKQQERFRYHARDLAIMRASINQIPIVLGSATPSLESLQNVKRNRYHYLCLPERAGSANLPQYQLLDLKNLPVENGLSLPLIEAMKEHLNQDNQVMLFLNRRGFAPVLYCTECAWIAECKRCDARLVYHAKPLRLHCHHCDSQNNIPPRCESCGQKALQPLGLGTQRLEQTLTEIFPDVPIIRVDRDNTKRKGAIEKLLNEINENKKAILLGTQMLAKGHHFPQVTLVGIVDADSGFFSADFRAVEQIGQLLLQVAGRAGRVEKQGVVLIQTRYPENILLQTLIQSGYQHFAENLLTERKEALLPPFSYFANFRAESYNQKTAHTFLTDLKEICESASDGVTLLGPVPALLAKKKGLYCQHLLLKAEKRSALQSVLKKVLARLEKSAAVSSVKWILDVDPVEVM